jgi:hypothetical protein
MLSSILLKLLNAEIEGAAYPTQGNLTRKVTSTAYVDDANTHHTSKSGQPEDLIQSMSGDYNKCK